MYESSLQIEVLVESPSNKRRRLGPTTASNTQLVELDNLPWLSESNLAAIQQPISTSLSEETIARIKKKLELYRIPVFITSVSLIQIGLYYTFGFYKLLLPFGLDPYRRYEIWRYVTILLVHNTSIHLWVNIIGQLILGILLEISNHWTRVCVIYLSSVVGGSLFINLFAAQVYASGASAGQYGLLFAHVSTLMINWSELRWRRWRLFLLLCYLAFDIGLAPVLQYLWEIQINVSNAAHAGGAITGFLVSTLVLKSSFSHKWTTKLQIFCGFGLVLFLIVAIVVNLAVSERYLSLPNTSLRFEYEKTHAQHYERTLSILHSYIV